MLQVQPEIWSTVAVLCPQGQIVTGETEILRNAVQSLPEVTAVKLDLARVTTVDAGGLGVMCASNWIKGNSLLELMNVSRLVSKVFELARSILFSKLLLELNSFQQLRVPAGAGNGVFASRVASLDHSNIDRNPGSSLF